jgi:hypothetical protein
MNLDEYKKFVNDKRLFSRIDAMAILENAAKQNELIHSQKENEKTNEHTLFITFRLRKIRFIC